MRSILKSLLLVITLLLTSMATSSARWETVVHLNQKYVKAAQIPRYYHEYGFTKSFKNSKTLRFTARNKKTVLDFTIGAQEVYLNGIKFHFSFPVVAKGGSYLISQLDLHKLLDPILRPAYIKNSRPFRTVILDPGHGGADPGASNRYGAEKNYTLSLAKKVKAKLERQGFRVAMTRNSNKTISLQQRVSLANKFDDAIFISLHFNSGGAGRAEGIETFSLSPTGVAHYGRGLKASDFRAKTGNNHDTSNIALATAIHGRTIRYLKAKDRGIRRARYTVLTGIKHPAILFEGGFLSHYKEATKINNETYINNMAQRIFEGIVLYKTATERNR